jgi:hypothetical protein
MKDKLREHKKRMLAFATKKRKFKLPKPPPSETEANGELHLLPKYELDKVFVRKKIRQTEVRTMAFEMDLARVRGNLIERDLVTKQAAFLLVAMRQKLLAIPSSYARKFLNITDIKQAHALLQTMAYQILNEVKNLPKQVVDPNWLEQLEEED